MAEWAEVTALAEEGNQVLVVEILPCRIKVRPCSFW